MLCPRRLIEPDIRPNISEFYAVTGEASVEKGPQSSDLTLTVEAIWSTCADTNMMLLQGQTNTADTLLCRRQSYHVVILKRASCCCITWKCQNLVTLKMALSTACKQVMVFLLLFYFLVHNTFYWITDKDT